MKSPLGPRKVTTKTRHGGLHKESIFMSICSLCSLNIHPFEYFQPNTIGQGDIKLALFQVEMSEDEVSKPQIGA